ncbi:hypothetical protein EVAR_40966_1 [Eumeta japonica]|uniref:Uncharacterized protein n=1 Tax=Eumeta variegata TaxID=151549 RepID=A0A4C1X3T4_EUMVA|nr:hypothetical protein EVAR_40966_1 [Eumeta japonica]
MNREKRPSQREGQAPEGPAIRGGIGRPPNRAASSPLIAPCASKVYRCRMYLQRTPKENSFWTAVYQIYKDVVTTIFGSKSLHLAAVASTLWYSPKNK